MRKKDNELNRSFLVLGIAGAFHALGATAAEKVEAPAVEVVGNTPLSSIGLPVNQVPANVQTASDKAFKEQKSLNVSEFLDGNLASVSVNDTLSNPYQLDVSYRGFTASPLLGTPQGLSVFLDGVRVNEPFGDIVNWDLIPANAISRINLIPGSNPLFGLNTLGGALTVHTKRGSTDPGASISFTGGSWGRRAFEFEAGGQKGPIDYFVAGNSFHENGWREASDSAVQQLFSRVGWQNDKSSLDLSLILADNKMHGIQSLPAEEWNKPRQAYSIPDHIKNEMTMLTLNGSHFLAEDKQLAANLYFRHNRASGFNSNMNNEYPGDGELSESSSARCDDVVAPSSCDPHASNVLTSTNTRGYGGALQLTLLGDLWGRKNQFTGGFSFDFGRTDFSSDTQIARVVGIRTVSIWPYDVAQMVRLNADNDYYGLYATDTFSLTDRLHLTLSGRYNFAKVNLKGSSSDITDDTLEPGNLSGRHRYSRFNPAIGINFNPVQAVSFYGGYNEGMRAPTPVELSCADPEHPCALPNAFGGDPDLKKVVSRTWEGGVRGRLAEDIDWNAGFYRTENTDDIGFIASNTSGSGYFQNVGKTLRRGMEFGLHGKAGKFSFSANYGFVNATYQTPFVAKSGANSTADDDNDIQVGKGDRIPSVPRHTLKLRLGYAITEAWSVGANILATSSQYARGDENNQDRNGRITGYAVVNLDTQYSLSRNWRVFAKIINLFDRKYATYGLLGVNEFTGPGHSFSSNPSSWNHNDLFRTPAPPRAGWVGVTYDFDKP